MESYEKKYKEAQKWIESIYSELSHEQQMEAEEFFPELKESEDERIRKEIIETFKNLGDGKIPIDINYADIFTWLEKQGKQPSAIRWYDVSLIPQEMEELLVEWDSEDATWHEIAFYHADTKTFWNGTRQVENVTRWCYIIDLLEKQGKQKPVETVKWSPQEESCICQLESLVKEQWRHAEKVNNAVDIKRMQELMFFLKTLNPNKKPQRMISAEAKEAMYDKSTNNDMKEALRTEYEKGRADVLRVIDPDEMVADFCSQPFSKTRSIASVYRQGITDILKRINKNEKTSITGTHSIDNCGL